VIVGENGSGKTTLLEAIFLSLGATTEIGARFRAQRGMDGNFGGTTQRIEKALWGELFHNHDMSKTVSLTIEGDGAEARSLTISRGEPSDVVLSLVGGGAEEETIAPVEFNWKDSKGKSRRVQPTITEGKIVMPGTGEDLPDFYLIPANQVIGSLENAMRFSDLSQRNRQVEFINIFRRLYPWVRDINIEVYAGAPVLFVTTEAGLKLPLPNVSSGMNRIVGIMLAISSGVGGVCLVDEIENGIFYKHMEDMWRALIASVRGNESQVFVSTHSRECLLALNSALDGKAKDVRLWRTENEPGNYRISEFGGEDLQIALEYDQEVR